MPTYNESGNIQTAVSNLFAHNPDVELLVVDDSSPDGTGDLADAIAAKDKRVKVLHRKGKDGLGAAYIAGFNWAFEHDYEFLQSLVAVLSLWGN